MNFGMNYLDKTYKNNLTELEKHWESLLPDKLRRQICNYCLYLMIRLDSEWEFLRSSELTSSLTLDKLVFLVGIMFV